VSRLFNLLGRRNAFSKVRILDTPGLADTRNLQQDELHKTSITEQKLIDSVTAVLVLANGTIPRVTSGTNHALSVLSAIFPGPLTNNIAFMFTNVSSSVHLNFPEHTLPGVLKDAPQFLLNNPIALQKKYLKLKDDPSVRSQQPYFRGAVEASEQDALEMLVELFNWLDRLEPQPVSPYEQFQSIVAKISDPLAQRAKALLRAIKDKAQAGVRRVKRVFISE
jgi:hypothetical protein